MSFKRSFLNFSKKNSNLNILAFIYLVKTLSQRFIYLFLAFIYLVKTLLQLWVSDFMTPKKSIVFTTYLRRRFYDQVSTSNTSCFWSRFPVSVQRKGIFDIVWFTNQEQLPLFWQKIQQGCGWGIFSVAGIEIRGYNIYMLQWYFKTIFGSL